MIIIFWVVLAILLFTYFGYPFLLILVAQFSKKPKADESFSPLVSLIIPAYNEEKIIARKIENSLSLDYPKENLEIIVASDGSTDNTKKITLEYIKRGIKFFEFPRAGKLNTLNCVFPKTKGEIIILTDASAIFMPDAIKKLVRHFINEDIGVVTGVEKIVGGGSCIYLNERKYWNYETKLKELEGRIYSTAGANGPIYAMRRELFPSIPSHLNICDDMAISLNAVQKGKRIILEPEAIALEEVSLSIKDELRRKIRIATRAWQTLFYHKNLLLPFKSPIAFFLIFHKLFRWLTFPFMVVLFISNLFIHGTIFVIFLIAQTVFYILSIISSILLLWNIKIPSPLAFLGYFFITILTQVIGLFNAIFKKGKPLWQPIERKNEKI